MFLEKSNLALCAACGEPSVFALVKSSLDCIFWQWHIYLLDSVLLLAGCYKRGFLYHGEDPSIIHHCCPLWPSRSFVLLSSPVHFSQNVQNCWFGHSFPCYLSGGFDLFLNPNNCLFYLFASSLDCMMWVHSKSFQIQMAITPDPLPAKLR